MKELTITAASHLLIGLLGLTVWVVSLVSMRKENQFGNRQRKWPGPRENEKPIPVTDNETNNTNFSNRRPVVLDADLGHHLELENCRRMDRMKKHGN